MSLRTQYLLGYNALSGTLWAIVFAGVLTTLATSDYTHTYAHVGRYTQWIQTLAVLEIVHSATGLVRAPIFTTGLQVASRLFLVHAIVAPFPRAAAVENPGYSSMLLAWSATEIVRYAFFVRALSASNASPASKNDAHTNPSPAPDSALGKVLTWLRYNTFFVLYPVGISSEVSCIWYAMGRLKRLAAGNLAFSGAGRYGLAWWGCVAVLGVYVPGSWILYTHMMAQRRKVIRAERGASKVDSKRIQ